MENGRFDALARRFMHTSPRRAVVGLVAGTTLGSVFSTTGIRKTSARKRSRKCKACRKQKGCKCENAANLGVGTICEEGNCRPGATSACSTNNDFCAQQWAHCQDNPGCGCFITVEGEAICGNVEIFSGCPATTECTSSDQCGSLTSFCVNLSCCPEGKAACRPLCVT